MKDKKTILIIILAVLSIGALIFGVLSQRQVVSKSVEVASLKEELSILNEKSSEDLLNISELSEENKSVSLLNTELEKKLADLNVEVDSLEEQLKKSKSLYATSEKNLTTLQNSVMCKDRPSKIDYSSNSSVSESLKKWIDDPEYSNANWDTVWGNSKVAIHKISGKYLEVFLVYFDEADLGFSNGVFDVGQQCWVNK